MDSKKLYPWVQESLTRKQRFKVPGARFKGDIRGRFLTQMVVDAWNPLLGEGMEADTTVSFKGRLEKSMNRMGIEDMICGRGEGFSSVGQHGRYRLGGPKGCSCPVNSLFFGCCYLLNAFPFCPSSVCLAAFLKISEG